MKELITKLNFESIIHGVAKDAFVFYCAPGIIKESADVLFQLAQSGHEIFIVCDLDSQNDYRGLNEVEELKRLYEIKNIHIKNSKGINVSFVSDLRAFNYFIFPVSKIFKNDPEGYNAVAFDGFLALNLFAGFFHEIVERSPDKFENLMKKNEIN